MARAWYWLDNTAGLTAADLAILNRATRKLVDGGMSPTHKWLSCVLHFYRAGMSARNLIDAVDAERAKPRPSTFADGAAP